MRNDFPISAPRVAVERSIIAVRKPTFLWSSCSLVGAGPLSDSHVPVGGDSSFFSFNVVSSLESLSSSFTVVASMRAT